MKSGAIVLLAIVMLVMLVRRYLATRRMSALWLAVFWAFLGATAVTGQQWLILPAAVALGVGLYLHFSVTGQAKRTRQEQKAEKDRQRSEWLKEVRAKDAAEEPVPEKPAPAVLKAVPVEGFTRVRVQVPEELVYPAGENRELVVSPGEIEMSIRARQDPERSQAEECSVAKFEWRLSDAEGAVWQVDLWWFPWKLNEPWHDSWEPPRVSEFLTWRDAPPEWIDAMDHHCFLVEEEGTLVDSRDVLRPVISGVEREVFTKYQGPRMDAASIPSSNRVVVRVRDLQHTFTEVGWDQSELEGLEPFAYEMRWEDFLPTHEPDFFYVEWGEWRELSAKRQAERTPFSFSRVSETAEPQPLVTTRTA